MIFERRAKAEDSSGGQPPHPRDIFGQMKGQTVAFLLEGAA